MTEAVWKASDGTRYRDEGVGRPLVLIHGVGMDLAMWDAVAADLRGHRRIVRYDMLGHGQSAKPAGPYRLADFVAQLGRLIVELDLGTVDLVGFSMGGLVAQAYAIAHPDGVGRLVLVNTVYDRSPEQRAAIAARVDDVRNGAFAASVDAAIDRWFTPSFRQTRAAEVDRVRRHLLGNDLDAYAAAYAVFASSDTELVAATGSIRSPVLVITGSDDQRSTAAMARALAANVPDGRAEIIEGQRHLTPIEVPSRLAASILAFVDNNQPLESRAVS